MLYGHPVASKISLQDLVNRALTRTSGRISGRSSHIRRVVYRTTGTQPAAAASESPGTEPSEDIGIGSPLSVQSASQYTTVQPRSHSSVG